MERGLASPHRRGNDGTGPRGLWTDNDGRPHSLWPGPERLRRQPWRRVGRIGDQPFAAGTMPDAPPAQHAYPPCGRGRPARTRPRPDVHLWPDGLSLRTRREPAQQPARRPDPQDAALPRARRPPRQEHHRCGAPARRGDRSWCRSDARPGRAGIEDAGRDRRRVRGGLPRRRGAGQHPAGPRLPAGDRAHRGHAPAGRGARGRAATRMRRPRATSTTTWPHSMATGDCRATPSPTCAPATEATSSRTSATRPTSRCGRRPGQAGC